MSSNLAARYGAFFDSMVKLVPLSFYKPEQQTDLNSKYVQHKKGLVSSKGKRKAEAKEVSSEDASVKRAKLDDQAGSSSSDDSPIEEAVASPGEKVLGLQSATASIAELRQRLQAKIQALAPKHKPTSEKRNRVQTPKRTKANKERLTPNIVDEPLKLSADVQDEADTREEEPTDFAFAKVINDNKPARPSYVQMKKKKSNNKKLLQRVQSFAENLGNMEEVEAAKVKHEKLLKNVMLKAQGVAVKDDPKMLKKAIKKEERKKKKSRLEWEERKKQVSQGKRDRQTKRADNIKERQERKQIGKKPKTGKDKSKKTPTKRPQPK